MGEVHLKIRSHKRGLGLKRICVMNMRDLRHEYERGCILKVALFGNLLWGLIWLICLQVPCLRLKWGHGIS